MEELQATEDKKEDKKEEKEEEETKGMYAVPYINLKYADV